MLRLHEVGLRETGSARQEAARHLYEGSGYREVRRGMVGPIKSISYEKNLA